MSASLLKRLRNHARSMGSCGCTCSANQRACSESDGGIRDNEVIARINRARGNNKLGLIPRSVGRCVEGAGSSVSDCNVVQALDLSLCGTYTNTYQCSFWSLL